MSVVRSLVGHGVGRDMHEDPQVPNFGQPGRGPLLEEGIVLAIEPMVTAGRHAGAHGRRRLGDLLPGRLAGRAFRVHGRDHRDGAADPHAVARAGRPSRRERAARLPRPTATCFATVFGLRVRRPAARARPREVAAAPCGSQSRSPAHRRRRNDEGTTVGQADVRKVQDHPAPWRGSRDLPEPAPQAAPGVIG